MTQRVRAIRTLVSLRQRQGEQLREVLRNAQALVSDNEQALALSQQALAEARQRERRGEEGLQAVLDATFNPDDYVIAGLVQKGRVAHAAQAAGHVAQARASLEQSRQAEAQARIAVAYNDRRIEKFQEQLSKLAAEQAQAEADLADEEAQESSVARMLMRRVQAEGAGDDARH